MLATGPDWTDIAEAIGTAISAVTSIILIVIAVNFRDEVRIARKRPDLTLQHEPSVDAILFHDPHWNYDLHLRVNNKPGQDRALRVGLELVDVMPRNGTASLALQPPRRPFVVAEMEGYEATEIDLPANISRRFLVAYHNIEESDGGVELALKPRAVESKRDILPPGEYELTLALTASNTDATFWKTILSFHGTPTTGEELPTKLSITPPIRVSGT